MTKLELVELRSWILEWMTISTDNEGNESLYHSCDHYNDPEKGHCADCEMFVKMNKLFDDLENDFELREKIIKESRKDKF